MKGWSCDGIRNTVKRTKEEVRISQDKENVYQPLAKLFSVF